MKYKNATRSSVWPTTDCKPREVRLKLPRKSVTTSPRATSDPPLWSGDSETSTPSPDWMPWTLWTPCRTWRTTWQLPLFQLTLKNSRISSFSQWLWWVLVSCTLQRQKGRTVSPWRPFFSSSSRGRVVKALDLKSNGVSPRRFESCRLRKRDFFSS